MCRKKANKKTKSNHRRGPFSSSLLFTTSSIHINIMTISCWSFCWLELSHNWYLCICRHRVFYCSCFQQFGGWVKGISLHSLYLSCAATATIRNNLTEPPTTDLLLLPLLPLILLKCTTYITFVINIVQNGLCLL